MSTSSEVLFLIGAGASAGLDIPDMKGFYQEFKKYLDRKKEDQSLLIDFEKKYTGDDRNLETLITVLRNLQTAHDTLSAWSEVHEDAKIYAEKSKKMHDILMGFIITTCERFDQRKAVKIYKPLLDLSSLKHVWLFTTNYDRVIEFCCDMCEIAYSDGFVKKKEELYHVWQNSFDRNLKIAKIHGSVDWLRDSHQNNSIIKLSEPHPFPSSEFSIHYKGLNLSTSMIIPTFEKYISEFPFINLWTDLSNATSNAKLCFVIGYSLRDSHIKNLLIQNLDKLIVIVVGRTPTIVKSKLDNHQNVFEIQATFEEFITASSGHIEELIQKLDDGNLEERVNSFLTNVKLYLSNMKQQVTTASEGGQLQELFLSLKALNPIERGNAARQLAQLGIRSVIPQIISLLDDEDEYVRLQAVSAIGLLGVKQAIPKLEAMIGSTNNDDLRVEIILVLKSFGNETNSILANIQKKSDSFPWHVRHILE
jgi:hypothetical protein